jgi:beta-galactosidase GanA
VPGSPGPQPVVGADGAPLAASTWFDGFDPGPCIVHAGYPSGPNAGLAAVVQAHVGAGTILWLGCMPEAAELPRVLALAVPDGTVGRTDCSAGVVAAPRSGPGGRGMAAVEVDGAPGYLTLPEPMTDLLTGRSLSGKVELEPYGVLVAQADQP